LSEVESQAAPEAPPTRPAPTSSDYDPADDYLSFREYFRDLFVPEMKLELPILDLHLHAADVLELAFFGDLDIEGTTQWLILNMLPRIGKTKLLEAWVTWGMAYFPDSQWIYTSYAGPLAERSLSYIVKTMRSAWYVELYGDHVHGSKADHLSTVEGGNIYAEGTGGELTGKGAGLKRPAGGAFIVDDASKPDEALSEVESKNKRRWAETTAKSRRNSDRWCPFVICGQRLGPEDLPAYFISTYPEQTKIVKFATLVDPVTGKASTEENAVSIAPQTVRTATLQAMRRTRMGRFVLASQYQQEPVSLGGNLIVTDEFRWYDPSPALHFTRKVIVCDTAFTKKQENDFCVLECWGQLDDSPNAYLVDQVRGHWESPQLLVQAVLFWRKHNEEQWPVGRFKVESATAGLPLMQHLAEKGIPTIDIVRVKDKAARVQDVLPYISNGMVYLPRGEPFIPELLEELAAFTQAGNHSHDDQVDCVVDGVQDLLGGGGGLLSAYD
jgi:predicted phage terminase large subunit-like protein